MKITKAIYQATIPTGAYMNERPGLEAELEEGDDPVKVIRELKRLCNQSVNEVFVTRTEDKIILEGRDGPVVIDLNDEKIEIAIENANTIRELEDVKMKHLYPTTTGKLKSAYDAKMNQLKSLQP